MAWGSEFSVLMQVDCFFSRVMLLVVVVWWVCGWWWGVGLSGLVGLFILYVGVVIDSCDLFFSWFVVIVWFDCYGLRCLLGVWAVGFRCIFV